MVESTARSEYSTPTVLSTLPPFQVAGKVYAMSINLFAYLETAPSLDEMRDALATLGLVYRHTLPADERWAYPMHVFGCESLRVVYHAGDPLQGEAVIDSVIAIEDQQALTLIQLVLAAVVRHYGGTIYDPRMLRRGALL